MSKYVVMHTINGTVENFYHSNVLEILINKLPKDIIHKSDIEDLVYYGYHKEHIGNVKHCFYFQKFNEI